MSLEGKFLKSCLGDFMSKDELGYISVVKGPVVKAGNMRGTKMYELVYVGEDRLIGEIIRLEGDFAYIQVYENTSGLEVGEPVYKTGHPLFVTLGPGILSQIFDGIQRPLRVIQEKVGYTIKRGVQVPQLNPERKWFFKPTVKVGDKVGPNHIIGIVQETSLIQHKVMLPPDIRAGRISMIVPEGDYTIEETIAEVKLEDGKKEIKMFHHWPVRKPRPYIEKYPPVMPLHTGKRILDILFPIAKGGTGAIPGGFGTGKTVTLQQLAAWSAVNVVIYIGCGERGNEMAGVLHEFPRLTDPKSGKPLMERTILIANTSNMPVAAREASIYTGITLAEYYRDMGYDVLLVADSTSRWAEALREISARLEEIPAEEGYPSYLPSRLAEFYERAGRVKCLGLPDRVGSVTAIGAVSPPGGDFTEPVTSHTMRFIGTLWALDTKLAYSRHYPAINWLISYSLYTSTVREWWVANVADDWEQLRNELVKILRREEELSEIVRLLGPEALSPREKVLILVARMAREGFLQQDAFDPIDTYNTPEQEYLMLKLIVKFYNRAIEAVEKGVKFDDIKTLPIITQIMRARYTISFKDLDKLRELIDEVDKVFNRLLKYKVEVV